MPLSIAESMRGTIRSLFGGFYTRDALPLVIILAPILFLIAIDPASFGLIWFWKTQIGYAGFTFLFLLFAWDWHDSKDRLAATKNGWRFLIALLLLAATLIYFGERVVNVEWTTSLRVFVTSRLGVSQNSPLSFLLAMDFLFYAVYSVITSVTLYSRRAAALMITPVIYCVGSAMLDMMDAFFPENSLAFLQVWVYIIWNVVIFLLGLMGFHTNIHQLNLANTPSILLQGNVLYLWGFKGFLELVIFWPSSGVVSMIVYSLVIIVLMVKLNAPRKRKFLYALGGGLGTYFVNVIRITLIVLYVTFISLDFEAFHESIGEVLFIAWILIFLFLVIRHESASARKTAYGRGLRQNR